MSSRWLIVAPFLSALACGPTPAPHGASPAAIAARAESPAPGGGDEAEELIREPINEARLVTLAGNVRPEATLANDRGIVEDGFVAPHLLLQLRRPAAREFALKLFIASLQDPQSFNYHRWLTAQQFGERFGPRPSDIRKVTDWLSAHGLTVHGVSTGRTNVRFSGTAAQLREAFHTELHHLKVDGVSHVANMSNPQIPAALSAALVGVVSLNDFRPHNNIKPRSDYSLGSGYFAMVPEDLQTIYNSTPLLTAGTSGQGQTIVVVEDSDIYSTGDWNTFRTKLGLGSYTGGSIAQVHPAPVSGPNDCIDPGVNGAAGEAILDAEWASAGAPSASIVVASCEDGFTFGGLLALSNLINQSGTPPAIVSMSYGQCETAVGVAENAAFNSVYQQAVTEGVSIFVSSGDEGAAGCDQNQTASTHGIGVSGFASTPYNVAVGGTDFGDSFARTTSTYWKSTNDANFGSAKSYVPEIPWNDSCASALFEQRAGIATGYGTHGLCNSSGASLTTGAGSGGPSGCATGSPDTAYIVSGDCRGYPKPVWQDVLGNPRDGVRDLPDVSLFSASGSWGHYYLYCDSNPDAGGSCTGDPKNWSGAGGTSFASPIMAGFQALVNQKTNQRWGNPNVVYYQIAAAEYGNTGSASCEANLHGTVGSSCAFYDVITGDIDVNCLGPFSCYTPAGTNGVLSTSDSSFGSAYPAHTGWDFATGLGSVNVANLVNSSFWTQQ